MAALLLRPSTTLAACAPRAVALAALPHHHLMYQNNNNATPRVATFSTSAMPMQAKRGKRTKSKAESERVAAATATADQIDFSKFLAPVVNPPTSFDAPLYSLKTGAPTGTTVSLEPSIFGAVVRPDILHRVVTWKLACKRTGTAKVKTRSEVRGSKQKMAPQKGRGMARVGTKRSPTRRGGGKAHGPRPRDFSFTLPKKVRRLGLRSALAAKFAQNKLIVVEDTELDVHKTKPFRATLDEAGWTNALIVDTPDVNVKLYLASRNIPHVTLLPQQRANVYDILKHEYLILHRDTLSYLFQRVNGLLPPVPKKKGVAYRRMLAAQAQAQAQSESSDVEINAAAQKEQEL